MTPFSFVAPTIPEPSRLSQRSLNERTSRAEK